MRIAISALAVAGAALAAQPAAAQDDGILKQGVAAAGATAGSMAGTVLGGPVGGAVGGVVGGAVGRTTVQMLGSMAARAAKKRRKPEVTAGAVEQARAAEPVRLALQAAPPPRLATLPPVETPAPPVEAAPIALELPNAALVD